MSGWLSGTLGEWTSYTRLESYRLVITHPGCTPPQNPATHTHTNHRMFLVSTCSLTNYYDCHIRTVHCSSKECRHCSDKRSVLPTFVFLTCTNKKTSACTLEKLTRWPNWVCNVMKRLADKTITTPASRQWVQPEVQRPFHILGLSCWDNLCDNSPSVPLRRRARRTMQRRTSFKPSFEQVLKIDASGNNQCFKVLLTHSS